MSASDLIAENIRLMTQSIGDLAILTQRLDARILNEERIREIVREEIAAREVYRAVPASAANRARHAEIIRIEMEDQRGR